MKRLYTVFASLFAVATGVTAQTPNVAFTQVLTGLSKPIYVTHCGDDRLFVVQKGGTIKVVNHPNATTYTPLATPFLDITSSVLSSGNEQGLLGLAFHPDYKNNGYFYVDYITGSGAGTSVIERFTRSVADSNVADPSSGVILLQQPQPYTNHNGGCLQFGPDGYLYISFGDGGSGGDPGNRAQRIDTLFGKLLRVDVNNTNPPYYSIPPTNPFVNNPTARKEIWAYGLRNSWRYSFDRLTGDLWIGDVGQDLWEEVDFQAAGDTGGHDYGWRCYEGFHSYNTTGPCPADSGTLPVFEYPHGSECSITGGYVYRGAQIGSLYGKYVFADYCVGALRMLQNEVNGIYSDVTLIPGTFAITSFGEDKWGELYACSYTSGSNGKVYKITDQDCAPVATVLSDTSIFFCHYSKPVLKAPQGQDLVYQWLNHGDSIVGANAAQLAVQDTGTYSLVVTNAAQCTATSQAIHVLPSVAVDASISPIADVCFNSFGTQIQVTTSGGTFTGTGVDPETGFFNPFFQNVQYGLQTVTYLVNDSNRCGADTATFNYFAPPIVTLSNSYSPGHACANFGPIQLYADSAGGTFSSSAGTLTGSALDLSNVVTVWDSVYAFTISYTFTDANGCTGLTTDTLLAELCEGIESTDHASFNVYPNPASSEIRIDLYNNHQAVDATLFDVNGKATQRFVVPKGQNQIVRSIGELPDGVYMLRLNDASRVSYLKVVKAGE